MIRRPPRSTQSRSSAASDVYKRQVLILAVRMCTTGNDTAGTRKNRTETTTMAKSRNPKTANAAAELAAATREYRELASRIGELGLIHHGSVVHRYKAPGTGESGMSARKRGRSSYYQ